MIFEINKTKSISINIGSLRYLFEMIVDKIGLTGI